MRRGSGCGARCAAGACSPSGQDPHGPGADVQPSSRAGSTTTGASTSPCCIRSSATSTRSCGGPCGNTNGCAATTAGTQVHRRRRQTPAGPVRALALRRAPRRLDDGSPVSREVHAGFCERRGVRLPPATHPGVSLAWTEMPARASEQERRSRLGIDLLGRELRASPLTVRCRGRARDAVRRRDRQARDAGLRRYAKRRPYVRSVPGGPRHRPRRF